MMTLSHLESGAAVSAGQAGQAEQETSGTQLTLTFQSLGGIGMFVCPVCLFEWQNHD